MSRDLVLVVIGPCRLVPAGQCRDTLLYLPGAREAVGGVFPVTGAAGDSGHCSRHTVHSSTAIIVTRMFIA